MNDRLDLVGRRPPGAPQPILTEGRQRVCEQAGTRGRAATTWGSPHSNLDERRRARRSSPYLDCGAPGGRRPTWVAARPEVVALSVVLKPSQRRRRPIRRSKQPGPFFGPFAQPLPHRIHQNVARLFLDLVMAAQPVIEEIPLPGDTIVERHISFPMGHGHFDSRLDRKGNDAMEMIRHQQHQPAIPDQPLVIVARGVQNRFPYTSLAQMVLSTRLTVDRDEKEAAFRNPLRHLVRQTFANGEGHIPRVARGPFHGKRNVIANRVAHPLVGQRPPGAPRFRPNKFVNASTSLVRTGGGAPGGRRPTWKDGMRKEKSRPLQGGL